MTEYDLRDPETFDFWTDVSIRFSDQDPNAHVNNTAFPVYAESGRIDYLRAVRAHFGIDIRAVLANVNIDYIAQLYYPGIVKAGTRLTRLGGKSLTLSQGLFSNDISKDRLVATSSAVLVFFDYKKNVTLPVPDVLRQAFDAGEPLTP